MFFCSTERNLLTRVPFLVSISQQYNILGIIIIHTCMSAIQPVAATRPRIQVSLRNSNGQDHDKISTVTHQITMGSFSPEFLQ